MLLLLAAPPAGAEEDPLAVMGARATEGAAAGYVADSACRLCHAGKYESFQAVGMAQAFRRPGEARPIEEFGREFYHPASQRYYRIDQEGERLIFRRHQLDAAGEKINQYEVEIDWILGSGNRARSYLFQTEHGELYQVPLGWYSESASWGMSPGFEFADQPGVQRQVKRQCMFCHNAFPEVASGSDSREAPHLFPAELPQGIGCQRCHGPGAEHIRAAISADLDRIAEEIVNPARLPAEERDAVCFQCHMLPAVAVIGLRRFDRADYSFRPGERLSDYLVHVDIEEQQTDPAGRFEINHHGYRFWQSPCYRESGGELACFTCHDPHEKPASQPFRAEVAGVCRGCHQGWAEQHGAAETVRAEDCVTCHMPTRRTRDVVLVTMTDHRIARGPFDLEKLVEPLEKRSPVINEVQLLEYGSPPDGAEGELYRLGALIRTQASPGAIRALAAALGRAPYPSRAPYLRLIQGQLRAGLNGDAERMARLVLASEPELPQAWFLLGTAQTALFHGREAMASLRKALGGEDSPEIHFNYALAALRAGQGQPAMEHLDLAIGMRPNMYLAWKYKGLLEEAHDNLGAAREALMRALEIEPSDGAIYADLVRVLRRLGDQDEARRYREVGLRVARDPAPLEPLGDG